MQISLAMAVPVAVATTMPAAATTTDHDARAPVVASTAAVAIASVSFFITNSPLVRFPLKAQRRKRRGAQACSEKAGLPAKFRSQLFLEPFGVVPRAVFSPESRTVSTSAACFFSLASQFWKRARYR